MNNATAVVESIAPQLLGIGGGKAAVTVDGSSNSTRQLSPNTTSSSPSGVTVNVAKTADAQSASFGVDYATAATTTSGELTVLKTNSPNTAAYVQPTPTGTRVLTAIASGAAPSDYNYTFDVPNGTHLVAAGPVYKLRGPHGEALGALQKPWATDALGKSIPTTYSWHGKTLTQHVDLSRANINYPVLADPAWGYLYQYSTGSASPDTAYSELHNCFSCVFPIQGAPAAYPALNQLLPLVVSIAGATANFNCYFGGDDSNYPGTWDFVFHAAPGHVDGVGSLINFSFGVGNVLEVDAYIVNDWGGPGSATRAAYLVGAQATWQNFANNLASDGPGGSGGGGGW